LAHVTNHADVDPRLKQYIERYRPQCLRSTIASGKEFALDFMNFKLSKGVTFERVLIMPTAPIKAFIQKQTYLESTSAAAFYVAATRAKQSLAIIIDKPGNSKLPVWVP
jgi:superfamily I DNA/RNA helicase